MKIKKNTPRLIKKCLKLISISSLLFIISCAQDEVIEEDTLWQVNESTLSANSIQLPISSISASNEQSANPASNAIDNNATSRWSGFGTSVDLIIDLGSENTVDYLKIAYHNGNVRQALFQYYYSTNGTTWTGGKSKISTGSTISLENFDLDDSSTVRYIRLVCQGTIANSNGAAGSWNSILDIEVYGTAGGDTTVDPPNTDNLAYGKNTDQSTTSYGGLSSRAVDGNTSGVWSANSVTHTANSSQPWWTVDLGSNQDIGDVKIYNRTNCCSSRLSNFNVDVLNSSGSIVATIYVAGTPSPLETVNFDGATGRSIRVRLNGTNPLSLAEVEVYAYDGDVEGPNNPTGDTVEDILGDFWKVTVPVDEDGNATSRSCSEYDCRNNDAADLYGLNEVAANSDYSEYFYESDGWVVFKAFCGGATTENSQYPRTELRGLDADGDDNYFSMDKHQELEVTVKVLDVPVERPEVNMVQIHGPQNEPLRVEYNTGDIGLHLTVNENDDDHEDIMDYEIGDRLKVWVKIDGGRLWLELTNLDKTGSRSTYETNYSIDDSTGYWKVGCYLQGSTSYCDVKSGDSFCQDGGESDDYDTTGAVAVTNLSLIRDGVTFK